MRLLLGPVVPRTTNSRLLSQSDNVFVLGCVAPGKPETATVPVPTSSASQFVKKNAGEMDAYCAPQLPDGFIASASLRRLQEAAAAAAAPAEALEGEPPRVKADIQALRTVPNLHTLSVGTPTEEETSRPVLKAVMECISRRCGGQVKFGAAAKQMFSLSVSGEGSLPEDVICVDNVPLVASEAKRVEHSTLFCWPQVFALGGDICRTLLHLGVADPGVAGVICAGDVLQFVGVFLIPHDQPAFCLLSKPLNLFCQEDLLQVAAWVDAVAAHARDTRRLVSQANMPRKLPNPKLLLAGHFLKPVRGSIPTLQRVTEHRATLVTLMRAYKLLHDAAYARPCVLFPLGVVQLTLNASDFNTDVKSVMRSEFAEWARPLTPVLVYPWLDEPWGNGHPGEARDAYNHAVKIAVDAVTAAGVVMLDLRPANVMWRLLANGSVEVQLIDFEHVLPEGYVIDSQLVTQYAEDARYNVSSFDCDGEGNYYAHTRTNSHWLDFITAWANGADIEYVRGATAFQTSRDKEAHVGGGAGK